jgi:putative spermidine/putrescine transport system substrate-binding protein
MESCGFEVTSGANVMHCNRRNFSVAMVGAAALLGTKASLGQSLITGPALYEGERALYELALAEGTLVSNNTGPGWANWGSLFRAFDARYPGIALMYNDVGSGAAVKTLDANRTAPLSDTAYFFGASGIEAQQLGLLQAYRPVGHERVPTLGKHAGGEWVAVHQLEIVFIVNKSLVKTTPRSWEELLQPAFSNSVTYLDPRSTGVGQVLVWAANFANGGTYANLTPGLAYMERLHKTGQVRRVVPTTPYAQFLRGEVPVWINFVNDGLRAKYRDQMGEAVEIVSPAEGTVSAPYTMGLVKGAAHPQAGRLWLNFVLSDVGQRLFAEGYVSPITSNLQVPAEVKARAITHTKSSILDITQAAGASKTLQQGWAKATSAS